MPRKKTTTSKKEQGLTETPQTNGKTIINGKEAELIPSSRAGRYLANKLGNVDPQQLIARQLLDAMNGEADLQCHEFCRYTELLLQAEDQNIRKNQHHEFDN